MAKKKTLTQREILGLLQKKQDTLKKYRVNNIRLFGSYAKGRQRLSSDIDFIVEFAEPSFDNFMNLVSYLEKLFGRKIDILTPKGVEGIRIKSVAKDIKRDVIYV